MVKGGFSGHSPWMQFLMLILLVVLGILVFTTLGLVLLPLFSPASLAEVFESMNAGEQLSSESLIFLQGLSSMGMFLAPALVGAYLFSTDGEDYLKVNHFPSKALGVVVLLLLVTLSGNTVSDALYRLGKGINWPESLSTLEEMINTAEMTMNEQIRMFLTMDTTFDFLRMLLVMAVIPAVCEEAFFRGALQPVLKKLFGNIHLGVFATAFLFAFIHLQFYTFLPILSLGLVLGYLKEWSRSLWPSIIMHLINNGSIVMAVYFFEMEYEAINEVSAGWDLKYTVPGLVVFVVSLYALYRVLVSQKK